MTPLQTIRVAIRALFRNKMRAFLTTLGVIIGVAAVIAMVAIGEGAKARVQATFTSMGSNLLIVLPGSSSGGGVRGGFGSQPTLTWDDLDAIRTEVGSVKEAAAAMSARAQVFGGDENWNTNVTGTSSDYMRIRDWPVARGSGFSDSDVTNATKVALLGETVVEKLYGAGYDPVGESIRIKNVPFEVIGVLKSKGQSPMGQDYDDAVLVPETTFQSRIQGGIQKYIMGVIFVGARPEAGTQKAEKEVQALLRQRHRIGPGEDDDFSIRNLTEMASAFEEGTQTFTTLLAAIAAVSLLVGGIGIMNIMLVSVTERTREIGLRMAVGAKPRDILSQFLIESLILSLTGGIIGVLIGVLGAQFLTSKFGWSVAFSPQIIALAVGFSALVGVAFGLYPAQKASRLDPIEALRYE
ncbi:MAG: ABC transporter permease [Deltaproteobacteria bacterium]|nr:ABC transporter permease [Deltaproteobacteria bacterium]